MKCIAVVLSWACMAFAADKNSVINGVWRAQVDGPSCARNDDFGRGLLLI